MLHRPFFVIAGLASIVGLGPLGCGGDAEDVGPSKATAPATPDPPAAASAKVDMSPRDAAAGSRPDSPVAVSEESDTTVLGGSAEEASASTPELSELTPDVESAGEAGDAGSPAGAVAETRASSPPPVPSRTFGMNYWPYHVGPEALYDENWAKLGPQVGADLDVIRSLGAKIVRLVFWPKTGGFPDPGNKDASLTFAHLDEIAKNLAALLSMGEARGMTFIIAFANGYLTSCQSGAGLACDVSSDNVERQPWWLRSYRGHARGEFKAFLDDSLHWINRIVEAAEASEGGKAVLFYDVQNESSSAVALSWNYVEVMLSAANIPSEKLGVSILGSFIHQGDYADAHALTRLSSFDRLKFVDLHGYPRSHGSTFNPGQLIVSHQKLRAMVPGKVTLAGEFGAWGADLPFVAESRCFSDRECQELQASYWTRTFHALRDVGVACMLQWMLYDHTPNPVKQEYGLARTPNEPKEVMGSVLAELSLVPNPDFEAPAPYGSAPTRWRYGTWSSGSTVSSSLALRGPNDTATGKAYARVRVNVASPENAGVFIASSRFAIKGAQPLYVNAYIRSSNLNAVRMEVHQYDGEGRELKLFAGPSLASEAWKWHNYRHAIPNQTEPLAVAVDPRAAYASVAIAASFKNKGDAYLDVDSISASQ